MTVAKCFAEAAASYDQNAQLQRWAGDLLLAKVGDSVVSSLRANSSGNAPWLDVGSGTGYVRCRLPAQAIGIDIAMPMLRLQQSSSLLQADMQRLPFADGAMSGIAANLSMQWSTDLHCALKESARVVQPGGQLLFTVPAADTFPELRSLVGQSQLACNRFNDSEQLRQLTQAAGWKQVQLHQHQAVLYFEDAKALLKHFKLTGAQHSQRQQGLKGRGWWHTVNNHLEQFRQPQGIPLNWHIYLVEAIR